MPEALLDRAAFARAVFARSRGLCVICGAPAADAHHILERRLFRGHHEAGGYFADNGAALCPGHHLDAETTALSVGAIRAAAGIARPVVPGHLDPGATYDKWANPVLPDGRRLRGELYFEEPVQRALAGRHALFLPRAASPSDRSDAEGWPAGDGIDPIALSLPAGPVASAYPDHADPPDPGAAWSGFRSELPPGWRALGRLGADGRFVGVEVWDEADVSLPWAEAIDWFALLGVGAASVAVPGTAGPRMLRHAGAIPHRERWRLVRIAL